MNTELTEQITFLKRISPFELLPDSVLSELVSHLSISYSRIGELLEIDSAVSALHQREQGQLFIIRKGAVKQSVNNKMLARYGEGDSFAIGADKEADKGAEQEVYQVEEDALLYSLSKKHVLKVLANHPDVLDYWFKPSAQRIQDTTLANQHFQHFMHECSPLNTAIVESFTHVPAAIIFDNQSIQEAAQKMTELGFSSLVVVSQSLELAKGSIVSGCDGLGIVTDKDIRSRCVAQGREVTQPVSTIMTDNVHTINANQIAFDGLIAMIDKGVHHLPVIKNGALYGMLTLTDLMHKEGQNAAHITSAIRKAKHVEELAKIGEMLPRLQLNMTKLGVAATQIAKSISALTKAITIKLIELGLTELGHDSANTDISNTGISNSTSSSITGSRKPSVPFAWLCAGSLARCEQMAYADQDNALIYSDLATQSDKAFFQKLATFVCDGLHLCGFEYCPGNIMATNEKWCQSQSQWLTYFEQWVNSPDPNALLNSSVFFDLDTVYGDESLLGSIKKQVLNETQKSTLFIAHLSKNAIANRPPLGFFRDFVLISSGENKATMDLKHNAIAPIVDLARIYALSQGISASSTIARLELVAGSPALTKPSASSLIAAYEFLFQLRLELNAQQIQSKIPVSNFISPKDISRLQRTHLKDVFKVIKSLQDARQVVY